MFMLSKDTELTTDLLRKILDKFNTTERPKRERWKNYYDGKMDILQKTYKDPSKPCSHIVTNFCKVITDTYCGYIAGKPVTYTSNDDIKDIQEVINYNDDESQNINWLMNALIYGVGYELHWIDSDAQERYSQINPLNAIAIHAASLEKELLYFIRWYDVSDFDDSDLLCVEVYDAFTKKVYHCHGLVGALEFIGEEPHLFGDVPVSVFYLNDEEESIFNQAISLNDAYNELQSTEVDEYSELCDSYLTMTGSFDTDTFAEEVPKMKENRVLILPDGATANWLVKNTSDTQITNMLENIKKNIFKVTSAPDMSDENFMAQSGVAIKYKLVGFENKASAIVTNFTKAIQRRIELICNILHLKASDTVWRDVNINFVRNLPQDLTETITLVNSLKGSVSDATLLSQIPFVTDVQSEIEAVREQKANETSLYSFNFGDEDEELDN